MSFVPIVVSVVIVVEVIVAVIADPAGGRGFKSRMDDVLLRFGQPIGAGERLQKGEQPRDIMVAHDESSFSVPTEPSLQRIDQPQKTAAVQAEAALKRIGNDA